MLALLFKLVYNGFMALRTSNLYGKIVVTDQAVRTVVGTSTLECYGIWGLGSKRMKRAVRVHSINNRIYVEVNVYLRFGVNIDAVIDSVRSAIKYNVQNFSGMIVEIINVKVVGIRS